MCNQTLVKDLAREGYLLIVARIGDFVNSYCNFFEEDASEKMVFVVKITTLFLGGFAGSSLFSGRFSLRGDTFGRAPCSGGFGFGGLRSGF